MLVFCRVRSIPGPHFYLSPVADVGFDDDVDIVYNVSSSVLLPPGYIAIIMFWDAGRLEFVVTVCLCVCVYVCLFVCECVCV